MGNPLLYGVIISFFGTTISLLEHYAFSGFIGSFSQTEGVEGVNFFQTAFLLIYALVLPLIIAVGLFIGSAIFHICLLIVGAGKMIRLAADELKSSEKREILIANRTFQRAEALATRVSGAPWPYEEIPSALERVDAVIIFTSSNDYVISAGDISSAIHKRPKRELILIDGSIPRNIDPQATDIPGVHLYNVDDLAPFAVKIPENRMSEASLMIGAEVTKFFAKLRSYQANDTLRELHQLAEEIRQRELSRALNRMDKISSRQREIIDILTRRIINKLLYEPTARLKEHAGNGDGESLDLAIRELFAIS
jgi:glutamyl-tRNA reductase